MPERSNLYFRFMSFCFSSASVSSFPSPVSSNKNTPDLVTLVYSYRAELLRAIWVAGMAGEGRIGMASRFKEM